VFKTGLVSISFRNLSPETLVEMTAKGGLDAIEWGGDIHVPHGNISKAGYVRELCNKNNIACPSYGSYYRVGEYKNPKAEFVQVLECAKTLGSEIIRVWAGVISTKDSDNEHFNCITEELKIICKMASDESTGVALEFHGNTLTDNAFDTQRLIAAVGESNLTTYWQPPVGRKVDDNLSDIDLLKDKISNVHTFTWQGRQRLELMKGYTDWVKYLSRINDEKERYCMLEFIKDDSVEGFFKDAITLRTLVNLF
jgi:sugar phosphate isomerase/epimerase